jgi:O-antigen ligase
MAAAALLPLCCIAPIGWYWVRWRRLPWYPPSLATTAQVLAALYLLMNASWSLRPADAATAIVLFFMMIATLHAVLGILPDLEEPILRAMGVGAITGLVVGGALLCFEVFNDQLLRLLLIRLVPALHPATHHLIMEGGSVAQLAPYLTNHSICVLTLMFWPAALIASRAGLLRARNYMTLLAATLVTATVFASEHAASVVAFVGAGVTFALFRGHSKLAMPLVIAGWVAANLLVVPVVSALYNTETYRVPWLPYSAQHRVVIWQQTSEQIFKAPLFGAGIGTARALREAVDVGAPVVPGTKFRLSPSLHSHNAYLQVWYETGAVGAFIFLGLGLVVLRSLAKLPTDVQPYLAATFSAGALLIATSFSIWAPWLMASLAMASIFAALGQSIPESNTVS